MSTETSSLEVRGLHVDINRKDIANLHLGVYPPNGRVRVSAPLGVSDEAVRLAVIAKWSWIRRQRERFASQQRLTPRDLVSGESHYLFGQRYRLRVTLTTRRPGVRLVNKSTLELQVGDGATLAQRQSVMEKWYRKCLCEALEPLVDEWQHELGVSADFWGLKRMKTKWGSCNPETRRIWFNSELAKKPRGCLQMLVVHELVHLIVPNHGEDFAAMMNQTLPDWQSQREVLNSLPLAHDCWDY